MRAITESINGHNITGNKVFSIRNMQTRLTGNDVASKTADVLTSWVYWPIEHEQEIALILGPNDDGLAVAIAKIFVLEIVDSGHRF